MAGRAYSPREEIERQLNMSEEEKAARKVFFEELFAEHDRKKAEAHDDD